VDKHTMAESFTSYESVGSTSPSLLDRVKAQDQDAWQRLVKLYSPLVLYWCRRAGVPRDDRADVFQEVFRSLWRHIKGFQRERTGSFRAWLRSIVQTRVADYFSKRGKGEVAAGGTDAYRRLLEVPDDPGTSQSAASLTPNEETLVLRQALAIVQPEFEQKTWQAAWRTTIDGRSATEVAEDLGMTPAAVRKAKSRVLQRLRAEMEGLLD
jgi:RNA polymerase sigma-70 factor (ECF subfamily)